ncbi:MAG TPA: PhnD/SsuA/transferrin family substrate-binding protein [Burkholderiaceae bacterium]|nr:PhnD/SsuA/transferrin family substrate-binding protein [Burkholderiaceae bacterium]
MSKFQFSVCPHDTAKNSTAWFFLNTYLQRNLGLGMHFEPKDNFIKEREDVITGGYQLVYANPFSAIVFCKQVGFLPIAKPIGISDEAVLVKYAGAVLPNDQKIRVASATDKLIIHGLGLGVLSELGFDHKQCEFDFVGTHVKAAHAVIQGKADIGIVFNETWNGMAESSRSTLEVLGETNSKQASHCFCISSEWADKKNQIQEILCGMSTDDKGIRILEDLQFNAGFEPIDMADLDAAIKVMQKIPSSSGFLSSLV